TAAQSRSAALGTSNVTVGNNSNVPSNFLSGTFRDALTSNPAQVMAQNQAAGQLTLLATIQVGAQFLLGGAMLASMLVKS
ncbi:MAG: hypothetical protein Q9211_007205, partial [Gyalolechia sp. 1 TL-2023]